MKKHFKIALSACLGSLFYFLFGWFVFEFILGSYMASNTTQIPGFKKSGEEFSLFMMILSCIAYAVLLAVVFGYWANIFSFKKGSKAGAVIGVLIAVMADSYWYSVSHFFNSIYPLLVDVTAAGLTVGLTGGLTGWFLGLDVLKAKD